MNEIVIFSTADWDAEFWTNKQHMAMLFAKYGYRVLYVDSLGLRRPALKSKDLRRMLQRLNKALPYPRYVHANIWRVSPLVIPFQNNRLVRVCNEAILRASIKFSMNFLGMRRPIILTYNPTIANLCVSLPHSALIYHCVDDLRAAPHVDGSAIEAGERRLGEVADLCFATSPVLQQRMGIFFAKSIYEPNVCNPELFGAAKSGKLQEPGDLKNIPHPRAIFVGALSQYKVDFKLLKDVSSRLKHIHFIIIGAEGEGQPDSCSAPRAENIHILGSKNYTVLPAYMGHCSCAILPAPHNEYTASMFPMKFFEYLAAGLPVVSTNLPSLQEFSNICFLSDGVDEFCRSIEKVLSGERPDSAEVSRICKVHSWEERFKRMLIEIETLDS